MKDEKTRQELAHYLRAWARHRIYFGASCTWHMLEHHAGIFSTACIDAGPQAPAALLRMKQRIPPGFLLSFALLNESMTYRFPHRHPDAAKRGMLNTHFLDAGPVRECLDLFRPTDATDAQMLFTIDHIYSTEEFAGRAFLEALTRFLDCLPAHFHYAVELHNREYLLPEYFDMLRERNIAHVLTTCTTMPAVLEQIQLPYILTADAAVVRVAEHMNAEVTLGIREVIRRCINEGKSLYIYIDDKEGAGSAAASSVVLMEMLNPDLAKLSPIKKKAA